LYSEVKSLEFGHVLNSSDSIELEKVKFADPQIVRKTPTNQFANSDPIELQTNIRGANMH
jgi:hypothetical protein